MHTSISINTKPFNLWLTYFHLGRLHISCCRNATGSSRLHVSCCRNAFGSAVYMSAAAEMLSARLFSCQLLQKCYRLGCFHVSCCRNATGSSRFHVSCCRNAFGPAVSYSALAESQSA